MRSDDSSTAPTLDPDQDDRRDVHVTLETPYSFPAGAVTLVAVHRAFTEQSMLKYEDRPGVPEILKKIREDGYFDRGVSLYVNDSASGKDYLRFDCFEVEPHYHYHHLHDLKAAGATIELDYQRIAGHAESVVMNGFWHQVPFDVAAHGDIRDWIVRHLPARVGAMLREAGAVELARRVDETSVAQALDKAEPYLYATAR